MEAEAVRLDVDEDVAHVWLCDPDTRNAVSRTVHHQLAAVLRRITDDPGIRFVVLRGEGGMFSSGGDLTELSNGLPTNYVADYWTRMSGTVVTLRSMQAVVIAGVEGAAVGAGAALALAADIVIAEQDVRMRFPFAHLGLMPDAGTSFVLPGLVGPAVARDLVLTGRWIGAAEAHERGLIARLAPTGAIGAEVKSVIDELRQSPARTLGLVKNMMDATSMVGFVTAVRAEGVQQEAAAASGEYRDFLARVVDRTSSTRNQSRS